MLLKEVYVISDGLNLYHYSKESHEEDMYIKSNLTSGFLSALQAFNLEARESEIEFFASKDEYFLFTSLVGINKMLICVFSKAIEREIADSVLTDVWSTILNSHLIESDYSNVIDAVKNATIDVAIDRINERFFEIQSPETFAKKIFDEEVSISSLRVLDIKSGEILFENARPKPLLKDAQLKELHLLLASLDKIGERMDAPQPEFAYIRCERAIFTIFRSKKTVVVLFSSGMINPEKIKRLTLKLFRITSAQDYFSDYDNSTAKYHLQLNQKGEVMSQSGTPPSPLIEIFLSTLLNAIDRFVSTFIRKKFIEIKFYIPDDNYSSFHIQSVRDYYDVTFA